MNEVSSPKTSSLTVDSIWNKNIRITQSKRGYRFGLDAILLAHFLQTESYEELMEIGAGNGIIPVLLSHLREFKWIAAVEVQPELARLCLKNVRSNGITNVEVIEADAKHLHKILSLHSFDLIYANPPYRKRGTGRLNPSSEKAIARHEIKMKLEDLFLCAEKFLKPMGQFCLILPTFREKDFTELTDRFQFKLHRKRYVHSFVDQPPIFFLARLAKKHRSFVQEAPLVIYDCPGNYSTEMKGLLTQIVA